MSMLTREELLINITPRETRVAYVENGVLQEVHVERASRRGLLGNVYKGKVSRVLPGMQAAFVEVGLERTAFLHVSDIVRPMDEEHAAAGNTDDQIMELLREGQDIVVQVIKDPIGSKGARLTTQISIPSRYLVYVPGGSHVGISQKIESADERQRLKDIILQHMSNFDPGGYIVRTVADGISDDAILKDMQFLQKLWRAIQERVGTEPAAGLVHEDMPLVMRTMRDLGGRQIEAIRVDSRETYDKIKKFAGKFLPELVDSIEHYPGERPIFDLYGVDDEIHKALERKVQLKSGGYLIIDQTEAMTTIDVNTGAFVGHRNLEETIFKTNLEATQTIARQMRLRNLGGIIIIDFIDMKEPDHRRQVLRALEKNLERDHARTHLSEVSSLGLVQMTRKRVRESLAQIMCEPCSACSGRGTMLTPETVCYDIFREILREARQFDAQQLLVLASQPVVDLLVDEESTSLAELEEFIGKPIKLQIEAEYTQEQFDVVLM